MRDDAFANAGTEQRQLKLIGLRRYVSRHSEETPSVHPPAPRVAPYLAYSISAIGGIAENAQFFFGR